MRAHKVTRQVDFRDWAGRGKFMGLCEPDGSVTVSMKAPSRIPGDISYRTLRGAPRVYVSHWQEAYVAILAHELAHAYQFSMRSFEDSPLWFWEMTAEGWALAMLARFRSHGPMSDRL